jgi:hypothetical protein
MNLNRLNPRRAAPGIFERYPMNQQTVYANTAVKVTAEDHPRHAQAGVVQAMNQTDETTVSVKFDEDSAVELVDLAVIEKLA